MSLVERNESFRQADQILYTNPQLALEKFKGALLNTKNQIEKEQIWFKIALAQELNEDIVPAVNTLKNLADSATSSPLIKAYAIERMGLMFYTRNDPKVLTEIFNTEPYKNFYEAKNPDASIARLFEYGTTFFPLAETQARLAITYGEEYIRLKGDSNPMAEEFKNKMTQALLLAEQDATRVADDPNNKHIKGEVTLRKAILAGKLIHIDEKPFGEPEELYEKALALATINGPGYEAYAIYYYATFLNHYFKDEKKDKIVSLLSRYYLNRNYFAKTNVYDFFKNEASAEGAAHNALKSLGELDKGFQNLLIELGWRVV